MKRLFLFLAFLFLFIPNLAFAANSATAQALLTNVSVGGCNHITPIKVSIDTTATDLTLTDPAATNYAAVVGWFVREGNAHNITFKSGSTTMAVIEHAATDSPAWFGIGQGILFLPNKGEDLIIQSSAAMVDFVVYVAECSKFEF